jgi:hypothetical protein
MLIISKRIPVPVDTASPAGSHATQTNVLQVLMKSTILRETLYLRYNLILRLVHSTVVAVEKARSMLYFECVFIALGIQTAIRMCLIFFPVIY